MLAALALALSLQEGWEYRQEFGFVNRDTMERKPPGEFLKYALVRRDAGDADFAVAAASQILNHVQDPLLREEAHFARAESQAKTGRLFEAYHDYEAFILRYPQSDRATKAKLREMEAALELARRGHGSGPLGLFSSSRTGVDYLRDALRRYPREDFSAAFFNRLGFFFYERAEWDRAAEEFQHVLDQYADSAESVLSLYMLGRCAHQRFDTVDRDVKPLKEARRHYERFLEEQERMRKLSGEARAWVDRYAGSVEAHLETVYGLLLRKQLLTAEYYDWKGYPRAAAIYYRTILAEEASFKRILKAFPETPAASKARRRLAELAEDR
jgi:outer membrane protein assembly factor BamD (BamD/ComL family)